MSFAGCVWDRGASMELVGTIAIGSRRKAGRVRGINRRNLALLWNAIFMYVIYILPLLFWLTRNKKVLQPLRQPRPIRQTRQRPLPQDGKENDAPAVVVGHVVDRSAVPFPRIHRPPGVQTNAQMDICVRILPAEK